MQAIDRLVKKYLYTVIPDSIARKIKTLDEQIWEENRTTITGRRMLLVSLYERKTWDYQHISHSVMMISKCKYPGDHKI
eukprot:8463424-Karenia_brevis.AAC.1